jgi:hypothetical protein
MTTETRTTIELGDVLAIEFECKKCGAKIAVPIEKFRQAPLRCAACDTQEAEQWLVANGPESDHSRIGRLAQLIAQLSELKPEHFAMRLEIASQSKPE